MLVWSVVLTAILATSSAINLPGVPSSFTQSDEVLSAISDDIANKFANEYVAYMKTGIESASLRQISKQLAASHSKKELFTDNVEEMRAIDQFFTCTTCRATLNVVSRMFLDPDGELNGPNKEADTKKVMLDFCKRFDIQTNEVCSGLFDLYYPFIDYIMQNSVADTRTLCGTLPISFCKVKQSEFDWTLNIDSTGVQITGPKSNIPAKSDKDLKIVHLTDIHYDPNYVVGSLSDCEEPVCCQRTPSGTIPEEKKAGYWSDYNNCDTPLHLIDDAFDHIKETHPKIDYIYLTGDLIPHDSWQTTKTGNIEIITKINNLIAEKFPGVKVYPCVGNHEPHPSNLFGPSDAPDNLNVKWLYEHLWTVWSKWLPEETKATILKGGYYTVSPEKGFRIISLNNNDAYLFNFWVMKDGRIGIEQLQWLYDTLLAAEKNGEYVHILMHIPSGTSDCWSIWSREFNRVVVRFHHIIGGIFNGHTHNNEMYAYYSKNGHAINLAWNGGSLTSWINKNPNYNIYDVEPDTKQVVEEEFWYFDLVEANKNGPEKRPNWQRAYQFTEAFTGDLSPKGIDDLLEKFAGNPSLLENYWRHKMTLADPRLKRGCDNKCLLTTICHLARTSYDENDRCRELQAKLEKNLDDTTTAPPVTATPTTVTPTTEKPDPEDGGAASISALKITSIIGFVLLLKFII